MALLERSLIRLARELYPAQPLECDAVLTFHCSRLKALRVGSENECPTSELDLLDWIAAGLEYGRRLKSKNPKIVEGIFEEAQGTRLESSKRIVEQVVAAAGAVDPVRLLGPVKPWQKDEETAKPLLLCAGDARAGLFRVERPKRAGANRCRQTDHPAHQYD